MTTGVAILGSTGSIGLSTLDVVRRHPDRFRVVALAARSNGARLLEQCLEFRPFVAALAESAAADGLRQELDRHECATRVLAGQAGLEAAASLPEAAQVMAAIVGAAGLKPTLAAAAAGKRVLLANKESLVCAGRLLMEAVCRSGAELVPIDSEHNAVFQCLPQPAVAGTRAAGVRRIVLTASGGPLRGCSPEALEAVTPEQAVAHPNWSMGRKISVDSATLMNKGLELIEACWLFGVGPSVVDVVVHPQSVVHSMVEYTDGSVLAQLGNPDMRTPIAHAMGWPDRIESGVKSLDLVEVGRLDFETPDLERFPCLRLAREAAEAGGTAPAVLNAANEVAVAAFLEGRLNFTGIAGVIDSVLNRHEIRPVSELADALAADGWAREAANRITSEWGAATA
ncbi:MAG: 1-deoxy-D-xylulose 5-phosphate reductoisomerase [Gammaproteobacteria bacterium SG8_30]|nr:MAG: 1-deoxy-D-xylulose 5-phosphate reductoisomerase [Gammaproteobacteria bacterium SG8_30]